MVMKEAIILTYYTIEVYAPFIIVFFTDSHRKLIRWRIVTHGCIDGHSRLITFLKCSDNRATTVYEMFLSAVQQHQLPSRVRTDQGGENILVAQHMIERRGAEGRSAITGLSAQPANKKALAGHT